MTLLPRLSLLALLLVLSAVSTCSAADYFHAFIYHRFGDDRYPSTNVSLRDFAEQLRYLHDHDYTVLPLTEAVRKLQTGEPLPQRCAVLTVDDAYDTFLSGAMPLLRRYRYPVALFVSTDLVGHSGYLGWDELRRIVAEGVEIGNHTASHDSMVDRRRGETPAQHRARIEADIARAQEALQRHLGIAPTLFAYPFGEFTSETVALVADFGFTAAFGQHSGVIGRGAEILTLPRTPLTGSFSSLRRMAEHLDYRPLSARRMSPADVELSGAEPPRLVLEIGVPGLDPAKLRLFVNGKPEGRIRVVGQRPLRIEAVGTTPLHGRRDKYTLTAPTGERGRFYYFTQPWVRPSRR